jgi:peptide/nickel transport system permease protein
MVRPEGESMKTNTKILKDNIKFKLNNVRKQFKVFYRSWYGKAGLYILIAFIIVALLAPVLVHGNPFSGIPSEDYFKPVTMEDKKLNFTVESSLNKISATEGEYKTGSYYMFTAGESGKNYGIFAITANDSGSSCLLFKTNGTVTNFMAFAPESTSLQYLTDIFASSNHSLYVYNVLCSSSGSSVKALPVAHISVNGTIVTAMVSTNSPRFGQPSFVTDEVMAATSTVDSCPYGSYTYAVVENNTGMYLNEYYTYNLHELWSHKLSLTGSPHIYFIGNNFITPNSPEVIVTGGKNIDAWNVTGALLFNNSYSFNIGQLAIPAEYQYFDLKPGYQDAFMSSGNSLYILNLINGTRTFIYTASHTIAAIGVSRGSHGFPSDLIISSGNYYYALAKSKTGNVQVTGESKLPFGVNNIEYYHSGKFLLSNTTTGQMIYLINAFQKYPYSWNSNLKASVGNPIMFEEPYSFKIDNVTYGSGPTIALLSGNNIIMYSFEGNPVSLGPTFHTVSGLILPLGTNIAHDNVFALFIDSFPPDLEVGFAAGIMTILISLVVAMFIGYYSGMVSSFMETLALSIFLIPTLPLYIVLASVLGPSLINLIFIFSLLGWPFVTFSLIGIVRSVKTRTFVESAKVSNIKTLSIMKRHFVPNMGTLLVYLTAINIGGAVAAVSSFEILGLVSVSIPTWGGMLSSFLGDFYSITVYPYATIPPIVALTLFILAFIFISRGIDEVANPTLGGRK